MEVLLVLCAVSGGISEHRFYQSDRVIKSSIIKRCLCSRRFYEKECLKVMPSRMYYLYKNGKED